MIPALSSPVNNSTALQIYCTGSVGLQLLACDVAHTNGSRSSDLCTIMLAPVGSVASAPCAFFCQSVLFKQEGKEQGAVGREGQPQRIMPRSPKATMTMKRAFVPCVLLVSARLLGRCEARTWVQVIDTTIYAAALHDPYRGTFPFESTQLMPSPDDALQQQPSLLPTPAPLASIIAAETPTPTTLAPSTVHVVPCDDPNQVLYRISMRDSWGDGWSGTTLSITADPQSVFSSSTKRFSGRLSIFDGTMADGTDLEAYICLSPHVCYDLYAGGGKWEDEVAWSIRQAFDVALSTTATTNTTTTEPDSATPPSTVVKGNAPIKCQFAIPGLNGEPIACPQWCSAPTAAPTNAPTVAPSDIPSDQPTMVPSDIPTVLPPIEAPVVPVVSPSVAQKPTIRSPSFSIDTKVGSAPAPQPIRPPMVAPQGSGNELLRKPSSYERDATISLAGPSFAPTAMDTSTASDRPSRVPSILSSSPPTGGDALLALPTAPNETRQTPTVAPTGGDAKLRVLPTPTPTRFHSVRVGNAHWIWPSRPKTTSATDNVPTTETRQTASPQTKVPHTTAPHTKAPQTKAPRTMAPQTQAPQTKAPLTNAPQTNAPQTHQIKTPPTGAPKAEALPQTEMHLIHKTSIEHSSRPSTLPQTESLQKDGGSIGRSSQPSKSPSVSQSTHFFIRLQQNLAKINKEEEETEEEEEEVLASDYPSGAPSAPRVFYT